MANKYVERFDIHTMEGYMLRHRIEHWLEGHLEIVHSAAEKFLAGEPIYLDCLLDDIRELFFIIMFMRDVEIIRPVVYSRYKKLLNDILVKLEDFDNECSEQNYFYQ